MKLIPGLWPWQLRLFGGNSYEEKGYQVEVWRTPSSVEYGSERKGLRHEPKDHTGPSALALYSALRSCLRTGKEMRCMRLSQRQLTGSKRSNSIKTVCKTNSTAFVKTLRPLPRSSPAAGQRKKAAVVKISSAFRKNCKKRAVPIYVEARKAWQRTCDLKRNASETQEKVSLHKE